MYLIITDLPDYPADCSLFYRLYLKYFEKKFVYDYIHKADGFVLLTDKMAKHLPISNKPWVRVEGLYDVSSETDCSNYKKEEYKTILYTGTLDFRYGITNLLDAFNQIKEDNYRLWICGGGVGQEAVVKACEKDSLIIVYLIVIFKSFIDFFNPSGIWYKSFYNYQTIFSVNSWM